MKCLHLLPHGGIANRIRALVSAQWMAERLGVELVVSWRRDQYVPAGWEDLYEGSLPAPPPGLDGRDTLGLVDPTFIDPSDPRVQATDVLELRTCQGFSFRPDIRALSYRFWAAVRPYLLRLRPSPEVRVLADAVAGDFGSHILGVHVRIGGGAIEFATPNRATQDVFFAEIDRIREETPGTQVYLASDSAGTISVARARYGSALIAMDDYVSRDFRTTDTVENVQVALAEIVLLSQTEKLLGTFFSSFAALAGAMGALPYKELCKPDREPRWREFARDPFNADD